MIHALYVHLVLTLFGACLGWLLVRFAPEEKI